MIARFFQATAELTDALNRNTQAQETAMADLSRLTDAVTAVATGVENLATPLSNLVSALDVAKADGFTPENQAEVDAAVQSLQAATTKLADDTAEATNALQAPAPAPAPEPEPTPTP